MLKIKIGDFVKSRYRKPWKGIVLDIRKIKYYSPSKRISYICTCLIVRNSIGKIPRKRIIETLNFGYLEKIDPIDVSQINKDWFKNV